MLPSMLVISVARNNSPSSSLSPIVQRFRNKSETLPSIQQAQVPAQGCFQCRSHQETSSCDGDGANVPLPALHQTESGVDERPIVTRCYLCKKQCRNLDLSQNGDCCAADDVVAKEKHTNVGGMGRPSLPIIAP